jgi:hypothetical protein
LLGGGHVVAGYEVLIAELRRAGDAAVNAGEQASTVDLASSISAVSVALPDSRSAQVAAGLAGRWREWIAEWSAKARQHGQDMSSSADLYSANEEAAERDLAPSFLERIGLF